METRREAGWLSWFKNRASCAALCSRFGQADLQFVVGERVGVESADRFIRLTFRTHRQKTKSP